MKTILSLLLSLAFTQTAFAWKEETRKAWDEVSKSYKFAATSNNLYATFWGGARRSMRMSSPQGEVLELPVEGTGTNKLPVYVSAKSQVSDLVIFLPGVFGSPEKGRVTPPFLSDLEAWGVHVACIPNFLSSDYILQSPVYGTTPVLAEARRHESALKAIIERIGKDKIKRIHVIGESLGALPAASWGAIDAEGARQLHSVTIIWPPLHLGLAVARFDKEILQNKEIYQNCSFWWRWPLQGYQLWKGAAPEFSVSETSCWGSWVLHSGFVGAIHRVAQEVADGKNVELIHVPNTFSEFIERITPNFVMSLVKNTPELSVAHWMERIHKGEGAKLLLISSQDDYLNSMGQWDELLKDPYFKERTYLFNWGGHSGPIALPGFMDQLKSHVLEP